MENIDESIEELFKKPEYLNLMVLLGALKKMKKVKRRLRPKQKTNLIEKKEFYCPYCLRKTEMQEIPTKSRKGNNYSILVCDKCFTYLGKIP